jgi:hypothetical protein
MFGGYRLCMQHGKVVNLLLLLRFLKVTEEPKFSNQCIQHWKSFLQVMFIQHLNSMVLVQIGYSYKM